MPCSRRADVSFAARREVPARDGMSVVELLARPRRKWCYLVIKEPDREAIVDWVIPNSVTAPELRQAIHAEVAGPQ